MSWTSIDPRGSPLTKIVATSTAGETAQAAGTAITSVTVSGLTNGTSQTFTVVATNALGDGPASAPSSAIVPAGLVSAPTLTAAMAGIAQVALTWTAPSDSGGVPLLGYQLRWTGGSGGALDLSDPTTTQITVSGLINGTAYTFTLLGLNLRGLGESSNSLTATPENLPPSAPVFVDAMAAGPGQISADLDRARLRPAARRSPDT